MKTLGLIILGLLLTSGNAFAGIDKINYLLLAADLAQTQHISEHAVTESYHEGNPILGEEPSEGRVNSYFTAVTTIHYAINKSDLDDTVKNVWNYGLFIVESACIVNNYELDIRPDFEKSIGYFVGTGMLYYGLEAITGEDISDNLKLSVTEDGWMFNYSMSF